MDVRMGESFFFLFSREREREREREKASRREGQREREGIFKQAPHSVQSLTRGSIPQPWDRDLSQNQESEAQPTEPPRCPVLLFLIKGHNTNSEALPRKAIAWIVIPLSVREGGVLFIIIAVLPALRAMLAHSRCSINAC